MTLDGAPYRPGERRGRRARGRRAHPAGGERRPGPDGRPRTCSSTPSRPLRPDRLAGAVRRGARELARLRASTSRDRAPMGVARPRDPAARRSSRGRSQAGPAAHPRRADRRADRERDAAPVRAAARAARARRGDHLRVPSAGRGVRIADRIVVMRDGRVAGDHRVGGRRATRSSRRWSARSGAERRPTAHGVRAQPVARGRRTSMVARPGRARRRPRRRCLD